MLRQVLPHLPPLQREAVLVLRVDQERAVPAQRLELVPVVLPGEHPVRGGPSDIVSREVVDTADVRHGDVAHGSEHKRPARGVFGAVDVLRHSGGSLTERVHRPAGDPARAAHLGHGHTGADRVHGQRLRLGETVAGVLDRPGGFAGHVQPVVRAAAVRYWIAEVAGTAASRGRGCLVGAEGVPAQLDHPLGAQLGVEDGACAERPPGFAARRGEEPYALTPLGALDLEHPHLPRGEDMPGHGDRQGRERPEGQGESSRVGISMIGRRVSASSR